MIKAYDRTVGKDVMATESVIFGQDGGWPAPVALFFWHVNC